MLYSKYIKRFLSIVLSGVALIITSPIMLITAILVKVGLGSPIIFSQERPGYHGKIFTIYKFRSMTNERDAEGVLLPNAQRHTKLGRFLRKTSLDELPQFYNIFKGDMAFIGPRPLLAEYMEYYSPEQQKRHDVRPGMANLSEIKGRNCNDWFERLRLDTYYAEHISFWLDVKIFFGIIKVVLLQKGNPDALGSTRGSFIDACRESAKER